MYAKLNQDSVVTKYHYIGFIRVEMKYISCLIEYKYFYPEKQMNLRLEEIKYKIKDKKQRVLHSLDYSKPNALKMLYRVISESLIMGHKGPGRKLRSDLRKINVVWWTHH